MHAHTYTHVDRCRAALKVFLPPAIAEAASIMGDRCFKIQAGYYDGSVVSFEVTDEEGKLKLRITTSTASCMVEVVSCVHRRVLQEGDSSSSEFSAELLTSLQVCCSKQMCLVVRSRVYVTPHTCVIQCMYHNHTDTPPIEGLWCLVCLSFYFNIP